MCIRDSYILNNFLKPSDAAYKKVEKLLSIGSHQEKIDKVVKMTSDEKGDVYKRQFLYSERLCRKWKIYTCTLESETDTGRT